MKKKAKIFLKACFLKKVLRISVTNSDLRLFEKVPYVLSHAASSLHEVKLFFQGQAKIIQTQTLLLLLLPELLPELLLPFFSCLGWPPGAPGPRPSQERNKRAAPAAAASDLSE